MKTLPPIEWHDPFGRPLMPFEVAAMQRKVDIDLSEDPVVRIIEPSDTDFSVFRPLTFDTIQPEN